MPNIDYFWELGAYGFLGNKILDMTMIRHLDFSQPDYTAANYVVMAVAKEGIVALYSWEVMPDGTLVYKGTFDTRNAMDYLLGPETGWEKASLEPLYWQNDSGFVLVGKGYARTVMSSNNRWKESDGRGLKVIYGQIDEHGLPTIVSSNVIGSGEENALEMLDVTGGIRIPGYLGVVTAHKTYDEAILGSEHYLSLNFWKCIDDFRRFRWSRE